MKIDRFKYVKEALLTSLHYTSIGVRYDIKKYINTKVKILKFQNLYNSINNVQVQAEDGNLFWCSYKDLKEINVGMNLTYLELTQYLKRHIIKKDLSVSINHIISQVVWEIQNNKKNKKDDFVENMESKILYDLADEIIFEIYFLYLYQK